MELQWSLCFVVAELLEWTVAEVVLPFDRDMVVLWVGKVVVRKTGPGAAAVQLWGNMGMLQLGYGGMVVWAVVNLLVVLT